MEVFLPFKWIRQRLWMAAVAYGASQSAVLSQPRPRSRLPVNSHKWHHGLIGCLNSVYVSLCGCLNCKEKKEKSRWSVAKIKSKKTLCGWVHVTDGPTERVEHVKSVAFSVYNSCSLLALQIKNRNTFQNLLLPCLVYFFYSPTRFWWVNKIGSYIVKYFFHHFSIMCAISLYWFCTLRTSKVSLQFVRFFHVASLFIYFLFLLLFFFNPLSESFSKLMCGCPRGLTGGTDLEFSGMSSEWFFFFLFLFCSVFVLHVMLLMWGCPLHIV